MDARANKWVLASIFLLLIVVCSRFYSERRASYSRNKQAEYFLEDSGIKGGLVVHIGCGDGSLTAALCANSSYLVHGLDASAKNVQLAREHIRAQKLYGRVSVEHYTANQLPYSDNLVNLIVSERPIKFSEDEIMRVLVPEGVAYVKKRGEWQKMSKPRPEGMDEWTHYTHDADGNPVAHDSVVGAPRHLQWVGSPRWSRHHDHLASVGAVVSSAGRIFYIIDEGSNVSIRLPAKWFLVARDAFNGVILWKKPIESLNTRLWPLESGPARLHRRLVAIGDKVYVTLGLEASLSVLDAATGETIRTYENTKTTEEILFSDNVLFLMVTDSPVKWEDFKPESTIRDSNERAGKDRAWDEKSRKILAVHCGTGEVLWEKERRVAPLTMAVDKKSVYFHDGDSVVCLDRAKGEQQWESEPVNRRIPVVTNYEPTLIVHEDVVLFSGDKGAITAFSAQDGKKLWMAKQAGAGHNLQGDMMVIDGLVWSGASAGGNDSDLFTGVDLHTGWIKKEFPTGAKTYWFTHRYYQSKATDEYLLPSGTDIEFADLDSERWMTHHWARGGCLYGIVPCNGLLYVPSCPCACYIEARLYGFNTLAPASAARDIPERLYENGRLKRGHVYRRVDEKSQGDIREDWPTYRHDPARSGFTPVDVPCDLKSLWQRELGGRLSSVIVTEGMLFVASVDTHTVYALDADSGEIRWDYTTGGRVDSPPTVYKGRVLFGSADGWVYCLRASDGVIVWRYRAAPKDVRLTAFEQLESVWPVHGSVLVKDDVLYCVAGRSIFLDGGMRLLRLDPKTGKKLSETVLDDRDPESGENLQGYVKGSNMPAALPDILSSDGKYVYMRSQRFDMQGKRRQIAPGDVAQTDDGAHLFCFVGFLDDSLFHRSSWMYGNTVASGWDGWFQAGRYVPSGRLMVYNDSAIYGYGCKPEYMSQSFMQEFQLYAAKKEILSETIQRIKAVQNAMNVISEEKNSQSADRETGKELSLAGLSADDFGWLQNDLPIQVRAMILANDKLFVAGPKDIIDEEEAFENPNDKKIIDKLAEQDALFEGSKGGLLLVVSAFDGQKIKEYELESQPVWDGMAAAYNRLYFATKDGRIICLAGK
ncbi:MAG: PQQ-binding-like beta-propeller repeat protein [Sedimentisphaerales bacterium]|nr:PQQ-binding-like beta-propeller repeat protein [Sedimentisphaerales bacterium]